MTPLERRSVDLRDISVSLVTTYPPTRCGIGRFSHSLVSAWRRTAPNARVGVARIAAATDTATAGQDVELIFDPSSPVARRSAARRLSQSEAVILQHEYGIYGPDDGIAVIDLVQRIEAPVVSVIHTVLPAPTPRQREIIERLGRAGTLVLLSKVARDQLLQNHDVDPSGVAVIPHGSSWVARGWVPRPRRRKLITWGLLGPGKGVERALHALARLRLDPPVTYDVVGQTHPNVLARYGQEYRSSLESLSRDLGLQDRVRFVDRYVVDDELEMMVSDADLVIVPYDNHEQVSSGVLTDAVAIGKPVVATAFPHARELVGAGSGRMVSHEPGAIAAAIEELLTDDDSYARAAARAAELSPTLSWNGVAAAYLELIRSRTSVVA